MERRGAGARGSVDLLVEGQARSRRAAVRRLLALIGLGASSLLATSGCEGPGADRGDDGQRGQPNQVALWELTGIVDSRNPSRTTLSASRSTTRSAA